MNKVFGFSLALMIVLFLMSCGGNRGELKLDCSSPQSFAESTTEMLKNLSTGGSTEEQQAFSMGMFKISMEFNRSGEDPDVLMKYDGWTVVQVIEHGE